MRSLSPGLVCVFALLSAISPLVASFSLGGGGRSKQQRLGGGVGTAGTKEPVPGDNPLSYCEGAAESEFLVIEHVDLVPNPPKPWVPLTTGSLHVFGLRFRCGPPADVRENMQRAQPHDRSCRCREEGYQGGRLRGAGRQVRLHPADPDDGRPLRADPEHRSRLPHQGRRDDHHEERRAAARNSARETLPPPPGHLGSRLPSSDTTLCVRRGNTPSRPTSTPPMPNPSRVSTQRCTSTSCSRPIALIKRRPSHTLDPSTLVADHRSCNLAFPHSTVMHLSCEASVPWVVRYDNRR